MDQWGKNKKLIIITSVPHFKFEERLYARGPYTYEIDPWAEIFEKILIAAPCRYSLPPKDRLAFTNSNILIFPQWETGGESLKAKAWQLLALPTLVLSLSSAMRKGDVIQVRCPCNLGIIGVLLAPLFSKYIVANYAGQWNGFVGEPWSSRFQRFILRSWWWRKGLVMVYGEWPNQPHQIIPFFTSTMTDKQVEYGRSVADQKRLSFPLEILFVGRLGPDKGVDVLLKAIGILKKRDVPIQLSIVGDGPERQRFAQIVAQLDIGTHVKFVGPVPYNEVMNWYEKSHVLVLHSRSEGWPKVLAEAMCFGLVCIATDRGLMPWMLKDRGFVVPFGDTEALATCLENLVKHPDHYAPLSRAAKEWAKNFSISDVKIGIARLLRERWGTETSK